MFGDDFDDGGKMVGVGQQDPQTPEAAALIPPANWLSDSSDTTIISPDDDQFLTASIMPAATFLLDVKATAPPPEQPPPQQHTNRLLKASVIVLWCMVILGTVYYILSEQQRRKRRLQRQRRERLEQFSPLEQAARVATLQQVLQATTTIVQTRDLIYHNSNGDEDEDDGGESGDHENEGSLVETGSRDASDARKNYHDLEEGTNTDNIKDRASRLDISSEEEDSCSNDDHGETLRLCQPEQLNLSSRSSEYNAKDNDHDDDDEDDDHQWTLRLPTKSTTNLVLSSAVEVPATCIICFRRYRPHDKVTWSASSIVPTSNNITCNKSNTGGCCSHAFHQHCIVEWLSKLPDCNCPVCRNTFCHLPAPTTPQKTVKRASS